MLNCTKPLTSQGKLLIDKQEDKLYCSLPLSRFSLVRIECGGNDDLTAFLITMEYSSTYGMTEENLDNAVLALGGILQLKMSSLFLL